MLLTNSCFLFYWENNSVLNEVEPFSNGSQCRSCRDVSNTDEVLVSVNQLRKSWNEETEKVSQWTVDRPQALWDCPTDTESPFVGHSGLETAVQKETEAEDKLVHRISKAHLPLLYVFASVTVFFSSDVASRCPACERSSVKKGHRLFVISSFSVTFRVTALWAIERQLAMSSRHGFGAAEYTSWHSSSTWTSWLTKQWH